MSPLLLALKIMTECIGSWQLDSHEESTVKLGVLMTQFKRLFTLFFARYLLLRVRTSVVLRSGVLTVEQIMK